MNKFINCLYKQSKIILTSMIIFTCLYPMKVNASSLTASAETLEISSLFFADLFKIGFLSGGVFPKDSTISDFADYVYNDFSVLDAYSVNFDDITISKAPDGWLDNLNDAIGSIYGQNGVINNNNDLYIGHIDNGYFTGDFYCDSEGNILATDSSMGSLLFNAKYGGDSINYNNWVNFYSDFIDNLNNQNLNFSLDDNIDLSDNIITSYYVAGQYWWDGRGLNKVYSVLYVPNSYDYGNTVTYGNSINNGFANYYVNNNSNYSLITKHWTSSGIVDSDYSVFNITNNNYTFDGYLYTRRISASSTLFSNSTEYMTLSEFINFNPTRDQYTHYVILQDNGFRYDNTIYNEYKNVDIISFDSVGYGNNILDLSNIYSYSDSSSLIDEVENTDFIYNDDFSYSSDITVENPIFVIPDDEINVFPSTIPFPNILNPDDSTTANPSLTYDDSIQPELSIAIDSFQNMDIPFIQNLQNRYPFSIPWDIANFVKRFRNTPTPPAWDFDWSITIGSNTYTKHFQGDLSDFNSLAEIFRNLVLISFIIALCKFSYDHHF